MTSHLDRRRALGVAAAIGVAPALVACGADDPGSTAADPTTAPTTSAATDGPSESPSEETSEAEPTEGPTGDVVASVKDVPVGGGTILPDQELVVTQPVKGEFHCFTAVCTHMGCIVSSVQLGGIRCECHGSAYSIEDGTPVNPPATEALEEFPITVKGGQITIA